LFRWAQEIYEPETIRDRRRRFDASASGQEVPRGAEGAGVAHSCAARGGAGSGQGRQRTESDPEKDSGGNPAKPAIALLSLDEGVIPGRSASGFQACLNP
jgi:hypothetical protein